MNPALTAFVEAFDRAYDLSSWHGPNLKGALRGVSAADALWRPKPGAHNIWELAIHAAYWKYVVRRKLAGLARGGFALRGSNWIASPDVADVRVWKKVLVLLENEHRQLREVMLTLSDADLRDAKKRRLLAGVAAHDLYHAGQIRLVRRLMKN